MQSWGGPQPSFLVFTRPLATTTRGRGRAQKGRGCQNLGMCTIGAMVPTIQTKGDRGGQCYSFSRRYEAEALDTIIIDIVPIYHRSASLLLIKDVHSLMCLPIFNLVLI